MGNCQAPAEAATVVIQHPDGRVERLYNWPATADEVMKANPGHHVAIVTLCIAKERREDGSECRSVGFTRVRLLQPMDVLLVGHVYKLITSQEVSKALEERRHDKLMRTAQPELLLEKQRQLLQQSTSVEAELDRVASTARRERRRLKKGGVRPWRPSLQSISEGLS